MPFIPHTDDEIKAMLDVIGASSIEDLFDEIPAALRSPGLQHVPPGLNEMQVSRVMRSRANEDAIELSFLGAGAYEHYIPAAVWEITTRGEFYTAYTPYQAEASQGTLQLLYEFQTMMAQLTGMDVSNASLYEGASALAEAVLMAVRANRKSKSKTILIPRTVHPAYRKVVNAIVKNQGIIVKEIDYDRRTGRVDPDTLPSDAGDTTALVIPQPNFLGVLEDVDALTNWGHEHNAVVIACVNPMSLSILKPPGAWGTNGADIACGEGQPLGIPLSSGGPYFGFLCCKQEHVRQVPGRIIGKTVDMEGKPGFALTLQAREQHIRRSKATSNICTNQGLMTTAATIYMSLLGAEGLSRIARQSHVNTVKLRDQLGKLNGIEAVFNGPIFHECVIQFNQPIARIIDSLVSQKIVAGYSLQQDYPELENCLLICATETKSDSDINTFTQCIKTALGS